MFPLPASVYICFAIALGTAFITHRVDGFYEEKAKIQADEHVIETQTKVVTDQAAVSQTTQKDKDDLQDRYDSAITELRGLRKSKLSAGEPAPFTIPSQGLRLLESNAESFEEFARQCANTELERNDVIQKYNALIIK